MSALARLLPLLLALCLVAAPLGAGQGALPCEAHAASVADTAPESHAHHAAPAMDEAEASPCDCGCACGISGCMTVAPALPAPMHARDLAPRAARFALAQPPLRELSAHDLDLIRPPRSR